MIKTVLRLFALGLLLLLTHCTAPDDSRSKERVSDSVLALDGQPFVSGEFAVDPDPVRNPSLSAPLLDVAVSGDEYLLTYAINGLTFVRWNATSGAASTLATLTGGPVAAARAVAVGSGWLVVYQQGTRYSVTVAADGTLGTPLPVLGSCSSGIAGLARSSTTALLTDACGVGVLMDLGGQPLQKFYLVPPLDPQNPPQLPFLWTGGLTGGYVAFNGIDYVCLYGYSSSPYPKAIGAIRVSPDGVVAPATFVSTPSVPYKGVNPLGLTANGSTFLMLLRQDRSSGPESNIVYKTLKESAAHEFTLGTESLLATPPSSTFEKGDRNATAFPLGARFGIVREDPNGALSLVVVDPASVIPTTTQALTVPFAPARIAASAGGFMFAAGALGVRFDAAIHAIDQPPATVVRYFDPAPSQLEPSFTFGAGRYLAGWVEGTYGGLGAFAQRFSTSGSQLQPASIPLAAAQSTRFLIQGADSKGFVSAWRSPLGTIDGARIPVSDPVVITPFSSTSSVGEGIAMASDGDRTSVAWAYSEVGIARFSDTGTLSPSLVIETTVTPYTASNPALVFHAGHFVVLWIDLADPADPTAGRAIYGTRVTADLSLIDSSPKQILRVTTTSPRSLEVVSVGDELVFAWAGFVTVGNNPSTEAIYAARLSSTLELLDPGAILLVETPKYLNAQLGRRIALRWDGSRVWLLWLDATGGSPALGALKGQRFSAALAPVDPAPWLVTGNLDSQSMVTMTGGDDGRNLVGYSASDSALGAPRVRARFLSASPFADGIPCDSASQCRNGACSGGHCTTLSGTGGAGAGGQTGGGISGGGGSGGELASGGRAGEFAIAGYGGQIASAGNGGTFMGGAGLANAGGQFGAAGGGDTSAGGIAGDATGGSSQASAGQSNGGADSSGGAVASGGSAVSAAGDAAQAGAEEENGGAAASGGAAAGSGAGGNSGQHGWTCAAAGSSSPRTPLGGLLILASALTLVRRRVASRRRIACCRVGAKRARRAVSRRVAAGQPQP